jgi:hypothetical protein
VVVQVAEGINELVNVILGLGHGEFLASFQHLEHVLRY